MRKGDEAKLMKRFREECEDEERRKDREVVKECGAVGSAREGYEGNVWEERKRGFFE